MGTQVAIDGGGCTTRLRLHVESIDLELESDGGLAWTSLATAFPGCTGLYLRDADGRRLGVRFDGKNFRPTAGEHWDRPVYVQLGGGCARSQFTAFGGYEQASKQFERSVTMVQQMMASAGMGVSRNKQQADLNQNHVPATKPPHQSSPQRVLATPAPSECPSDDNATTTGAVSINDLARDLSSAASRRHLSNIEHQFLDAARLASAKDDLLAAKRTELEEVTKKLDKANSDLAAAEGRAQELAERCSALETEMQLMRSLSAQQPVLLQQIDQLKTEAADAHALREQCSQLEERCKQLDLELVEQRTTNRLVSERAGELDERLVGLTCQLRETQAELKLRTDELDKEHTLRLTHQEKVNQLDGEIGETRTLLDTVQQRYKEMDGMMRGITADNAKLTDECARLKEQRDSMAKECNRTSDEKTNVEAELAECRRLRAQDESARQHQRPPPPPSDDDTASSSAIRRKH